MDGVTCVECGERLKVTITGGEFLVREGSSMDNLAFEVAETPKIITLDEPKEKKMDEDTTMTVDVVCSKNPDHMVFGTVDSKIKVEIYQRIQLAARQFIRKYYG